jgi:hypothetical protein
MKTSICALFLMMIFANFSLPVSARQSSGTDDLTALARQFVDLLAKEEFARAVSHFDATMTKLLPEAKLRELWMTMNSTRPKRRLQRSKTRI